MAGMNCSTIQSFNGYAVSLHFWDKFKPDIEIPMTADLSNHEFIVALKQAQAEHLRYEAYAELECYLRLNRDTKFERIFNAQSERFKALAEQVIRDDIAITDSRVRAFLEWLYPPKPKAAVAVQHEQKAREPGVDGFVYLLQSPTGVFKIGHTKNPNNRLQTFNVKLPFEVEYICVIQTLDMRALERELHTHFSTQRINGEWFKLTPEDVDYIKGLAA